MKKLHTALKNATLTKTGRLIAEYVLDHNTKVCFMTSTELARAVQTSEASVIRFSRSLGFSGYADFQKELRKNFTDRVSKVLASITVPSERLRASMAYADGDYIHEFVMDTESNIHSVLKNNLKDAFDQAISLLFSAKRKYILATRANCGVASYFFLLMKHMLPDVYSVGDSAVNMIDHLSDISAEDCVILFSFPRYSKLDMQALQMAEDAGASILVITDKQSSPPAQYADVLLTVSCNSSTFFNSYVGVQMLMEILCAGISRRVGASNEEKLRKIDQYLESLGTY